MKHAWHLFVVRLDVEKSNMKRDDFMAELKKRNIEEALDADAARILRTLQGEVFEG